MTSSMGKIAKVYFSFAKQIVDLFNVQQLAFKSVQEMRIKARWKAMDKENIDISYHYCPLKILHRKIVD